MCKYAKLLAKEAPRLIMMLQEFIKTGQVHTQQLLAELVDQANLAAIINPLWPTLSIGTCSQLE
jgi:hypothetical protein